MGGQLEYSPGNQNLQDHLARKSLCSGWHKEESQNEHKESANAFEN